jgi:hypothetical protein
LTAFLSIRLAFRFVKPGNLHVDFKPNSGHPPRDQSLQAYCIPEEEPINRSIVRDVLKEYEPRKVRHIDLS